MLFPALPLSPTSHIFVSYSAKPAYPLGFKRNDPTQAQTCGPHQPESLRALTRLSAQFVGKLAGLLLGRSARQVIGSASTMTFTGRNACFACYRHHDCYCDSGSL